MSSISVLFYDAFQCFPWIKTEKPNQLSYLHAGCVLHQISRQVAFVIFYSARLKLAVILGLLKS